MEQKEVLELLEVAVKSGIIDIDSVKQSMTKVKKDEILKNHPYKIYQGNDGRWRTYVSDSMSKQGRKLLVKSSETALVKVLVDYYNGLEEEESNRRITLRRLYPRWIEYKKLHTNAQSYIIRIESDWKKYYLNNSIIDVPIQRLNKLKLDVFAHKLIQDYCMTKNQYYNATVIIRQALLYAVDLGIIVSSPFDQVSVDGKRMFRKVLKKQDCTQVFSPDELKALVLYAQEDFATTTSKYPLAPLAVLFQLQTGIRIGELCALRYSDIENQNLIHIQRMLRRDTGEVVDHTKSDYGDRRVPLTKTCEEIIQQVRAKQKELGVSAEDYIFSTTCAPIPEHAVAHLYTKYCKKIGRIHKSSHKARKTYISSLIDARININTVRNLVGHSDERTTLKNYCFDRHTESERREAIEKALRIS